MKNKDNVCCCCLVNWCFRDINQVYIHNGKQENYSEMLLNTFNVSLKRKSICEKCIEKLRDAADFKQEMVAADLTFTAPVAEDKDQDISKVKLEPKETNEELPQEDNAENDDDDSMDFADDEKCSEKNSAAIEINTNKEKRKKYKKNPRRDLKGPTKNTVQLISNSNLCIFKPHQNNTEYACYLCKETCTNIKELREHSKTHKLIEFLTKISALQGMSCRHVDISNLSCICTHACDDLDALTTHLKEKHDIQFQNGGHLLIPYRLENGYRCVICKKEFNTFYTLTNHMNCHSTNNICDICGSAYFSRQYLRQHVKAKHRESKCRICHSKFPTASELAQHTKKIHKKIPKREYQCNLCNLTFNYGYKLKNHMVGSHGLPDIKVDCGICGKVLKNELCLRTHKRSVHDKERRFQCTLCDLRFFTKFDSVRHEKTHIDKCLFSCDYCETRFKSKDSLRRHMKKQHTVSI